MAVEMVTIESIATELEGVKDDPAAVAVIAATLLAGGTRRTRGQAAQLLVVADDDVAVQAICDVLVTASPQGDPLYGTVGVEEEA